MVKYIEKQPERILKNQGQKMKTEFEIVKYEKINNANIFIVEMDYRTPHLHRDFEISFILEGHSTLVINGKRYEGNAEDVFILNPTNPHEIFTHGDVGATILCLQISPRFFSDTLPAMSNVFFDVSNINLPENSEWIASFRRTLIESAIAYMNPHQNSHLYCAARINDIFYMLLENVPHHYLSIADQQAIGRKVDRILRFFEFVDLNFMHKINLQDFAETEGVSLNYMSSFIKKNLNKTFREYVSDVRFSQACKLLTIENKRLTDVFLESGFSDLRYLTKAFLQRTGMRPNEYRSKHKNLRNEYKYKSSLHSSEKLYSNEEALRILDYLKTCY